MACLRPNSPRRQIISDAEVIGSALAWRVAERLENGYPFAAVEPVFIGEFSRITGIDLNALRGVPESFFIGVSLVASRYGRDWRVRAFFERVKRDASRNGLNRGI